MKKSKVVLSSLVIWSSLFGVAPSVYANITMDVDMWHGASGTYKCVDIKACWLLYRAAEMRGDTYFCNSVIIKRDGKVVWYKNFYK